ncbi:MAG: trypsin-like peptidase domain-containing protein [Gammaproteobacteria bacterium]
MNPITGPCFRCETCPLGPDIDLCTQCHQGYLAGWVQHPGPDSTVPAGTPSTHQFARSEGTSSDQYATWLETDARTLPPPFVPSGFLVRPEFRSGRESVFGGYGFVIRIESQVIMLTALHVMDELIKLKAVDATARNSSYSGEELPAHVSSVRLYDVLRNPWALHELGNAGPMLVLPNARTADDEPFSSRDIAAFRVSRPVNALNPLALADRAPEPGDAVWLAAAMPDQSRTRRAVCVESTPGSFVFRYTEAKEMAPHSSGAALLDRDGAVVGINTGLGRFEGHEIGHANPLNSIRTHLEQARPGERDT